MSVRLRRDEQQSRTRAQLLGAAAAVFARRGYHRASLAEIADRAGLSTGAVYSNFHGKESLFLALLDERIADRLAVVEGAMQADAPADVRLRALGLALGRVTAEERDWWLLFTEFWTYAVRDPKLRRKLASHYVTMRAGIARLIEAHVTPGVTLPMTSQHLAAAAEALGEGYMLQKLLDPRALPDDSYARWLALLFGASARRRDKQSRPATPRTTRKEGPR